MQAFFIRQNCFCDLEKLIENLASAIFEASSNPCVGSSPRTNIFFLLLSTCTDKLLSTPKITTFLPQSKLGYEKSEQN